MDLKKISWLGLAFPSAMAVLLLWLPFGFSLHGLIEEWGVLGIFTTSGPVLFVGADSALEAHRLRPLTVLPHALAYLLTPDSFTGWHWVMILSLILKGASAAYIGSRITRSPRWGACFGLLVLLYPADTMQLAFRGLHINAALAMMLLGSALMVNAQEQRSSAVRRLEVLAGVACMLAAQLMYEVAFTLVVMPLLVFWCRDGFAATWNSIRRAPLPTGGWVAAGVLYAAYVAWASSWGGQSYQGSLTAGHSPIDTLRAALPKLFQIGFMRAIVGGWVDALGMARKEFAGHAYLVVAGLAVSAAMMFARQRDRTLGESTYQQEPDDAWAPVLRMVLAGLLLVVLGYGPYLLSPPHVVISQRTYLFAAPGGALVCLALLKVVSRISRPLAAAVVVVLLTLGFAGQTYQFHHYINISEAQRKILRVIVENFDPTDGRANGKQLLVLDGSNQLSHTWLLRDNLQAALTYLYGNSINHPEICLMPSRAWQRLDSLGRTGLCIEGPDQWTFIGAEPTKGQAASPPPKSIAKSQLLVLNIDADGRMHQDSALDAYRARLTTDETSAARRYRRILLPSPGGLQLGLFSSDETRYRWDFGRWWSLEEPTRGSGWREAEWHLGRLRHDAAAWKSQEKASLLFDLKPTGSGYVLSGRFTSIVSPAVKDSMALTLNGHATAIRWASALEFVAAVPAQHLTNGVNTLEFDSIVDPDYFNLSAQLSSVELRPLQ